MGERDSKGQSIDTRCSRVTRRISPVGVGATVRLGRTNVGRGLGAVGRESGPRVGTAGQRAGSYRESRQDWGPCKSKMEST